MSVGFWRWRRSWQPKNYRDQPQNNRQREPPATQRKNAVIPRSMSACISVLSAQKKAKLPAPLFTAARFTGSGWFEPGNRVQRFFQPRHGVKIQRQTA
jgi:hypothetical protein